MSHTYSTTSPLRYPGGKTLARKILLDYIPQGTGKVLSPFVGGGSFELFLTKHGVTVEAYDGFRLLSHFWKQLLDNPQPLTEEARALLGKVDKETFRHIQQTLREAEDADNRALTVQEAAWFYIANRCSFGGATLSGGYSAYASTKRFTESSLRLVEQFHNPLLTVGHQDFHDTLAHISEDIDLIFADPPYALDKGDKLYGIQGSMHTGFNHEDLRDLLVGSGKPFLLTYNNCEYIRDLYSHCTIERATWRYGMGERVKGDELIITNYRERHHAPTETLF